ncbi:hypothetical protein FRC12_017544 [Ceratobasidium sp. 428]|nr:hypothetical protein FRC12_017544 [Ceratobasidium sp. 428]
MSGLPHLSPTQRSRPGITAWPGRAVQLFYSNEPRGRPDASFAIEVPRPPKKCIRLGIRVSATAPLHDPVIASAPNNGTSTVDPPSQTGESAQAGQEGTGGLNIGSPPGMTHIHTPAPEEQIITLEGLANIMSAIAALPPIEEEDEQGMDERNDEDQEIDVVN